MSELMRDNLNLAGRVKVVEPEEPVWVKVCSCPEAPIKFGFVNIQGLQVSIGVPTCPHCGQGYIPSDMVKNAKCRICGDATRSTGTGLCDRCWELEHRILANPDLALKILREAGRLPVESPTGRDDAGFEVEDKDGGA